MAGDELARELWRVSEEWKALKDWFLKEGQSEAEFHKFQLSAGNS